MSSLNGKYKLQFQGAAGSGTGSATVKDGRLEGSDSTYRYEGTVEEVGAVIRAEIDVRAYTARKNAVVGPLSRFVLSLKGKKVANGFDISGHVFDSPDLKIRIKATPMKW